MKYKDICFWENELMTHIPYESVKNYCVGPRYKIGNNYMIFTKSKSEAEPGLFFYIKIDYYDIDTVQTIINSDSVLECLEEPLISYYKAGKEKALLASMVKTTETVKKERFKL